MVGTDDASAMNPSSDWRATLETFALRVANEGVDARDAPTFAGLSSAERAEVHEAARRLGLGSRSEGSDAAGTRAVTVFPRVVPEGVARTRGARDDSRTAAADAPRANAARDDADDVSAFDESVPNLRDAPFDMYKALRIPRREGGGYSGGTARARASYHREAVRCHPDNAPPGCGACHGCGGTLRLGRWMHRHATVRDDAPADDPEFGLVDDADDDGGDDTVAAAAAEPAGPARTLNRRANAAADGPGGGRLDLCPPCYARHVGRRAMRRAWTDDETRAGVATASAAGPDPGEGFVLVSSLADLGRERPRYDVALYAALRERRAAKAEAAARANARALAAVAGPEAMARVLELEEGNAAAAAADDDDDDVDPPVAVASVASVDVPPPPPRLEDARDDAAPPLEALGSETTRFADAVARFQKVTVAYLTLRDPERLRVLDEGGYRALAASEGYAEDDVFDADPWDVYDRFFAGEDEEDRQYLLLHGGSPDSDEDEDGDEDVDDDDDDDVVEEALARAKHERFEVGPCGAAADATADVPPPRPPVSVLMAMGGAMGGVGGGLELGDDDDAPGLEGGDIWAAMAERYGADGSGATRDGDEDESDEEGESDEEDQSDDDDDESDDEGESSDDGPPEEVGVKRKRGDAADE